MIPRLDKWSWIWMLTFSKKLIYAGLDRIWKLVSWLTIKTGSSLFLSPSIVVCICHTLKPKKSSKYGFIHYWCCIPWIAWGGCAKNKMQHIFNTTYAIQNDATLPKIKTRTTNCADMLGCCVRTKCAWYHYWLKLFRPPVPLLRKSCF